MTILHRIAFYTLFLFSLPIIAQDDIDNAVRVNSYIGDDLAAKRDSRVAVNKDGKTGIIWLDNRNGIYEVFFQIIGADGSSIGENVSLRPGHIALNEQLDIIALKNGHFALAWVNRGTGYGKVHYTVMDDLGNQVVPINVTQSTTRTNITLFPVLAPREDGGFILAFSTDGSYDPSLQIQSFDSLGVSLIEPIYLQKYVNGIQISRLDMVTNNNGNILITFQNRTNSNAINFDIIVLTPELEILSIKNQINPVAGKGFAPVCTSLDNGNFAVFWIDSETLLNTNTLGQLISSSGDLIGSPKSILWDATVPYVYRALGPQVSSDGKVIAISNAKYEDRITFVNASLTVTSHVSYPGKIFQPFLKDKQFGAIYYKPVTTFGNGGSLFMKTLQEKKITTDSFSFSEIIQFAEYSKDGFGIVIYSQYINGIKKHYVQRISPENQLLGNPFLLENSGTLGNYSIAFTPNGAFAVLYSIYQSSSSSASTTFKAAYFNELGIKLRETVVGTASGTAEISGLKGIEYNVAKNNYILWLRTASGGSAKLTAWTVGINGQNATAVKTLFSTKIGIDYQWEVRDNGDFIVTHNYSEAYFEDNVLWFVVSPDLNVLTPQERINEVDKSVDSYSYRRIFRGKNNSMWVVYSSRLSSLGPKLLYRPYVVRRLAEDNSMSPERFIANIGSIVGMYAQNDELRIWQRDYDTYLQTRVNIDSTQFEDLNDFPEGPLRVISKIFKHDAGITFLLEDSKTPGKGKDIFSYLSKDIDMDGHYSFADCIDTLASVHPGAIDIPDNGIDENCNGVDSSALNLPVIWSYINANNHGNNAIVFWGTSSQQNNDFFQIEKSGDGRNFYEIGKVDGNGTNYNSNDYEFYDYNFVESSYYRVRQVDYDRSSEVSKLVFIAKEASLDNIIVYPTQLLSGQKLTLISSKTEQLKIHLFDVSGRPIQTWIVSEGGPQSLSMDDQPSGLYFITILRESGKTEVIKIVIP